MSYIKPVNSICYTCLKVNSQCLLQRLKRYVLYKPVNSPCYTCLKVNPLCLLQRQERYVINKPVNSICYTCLKVNPKCLLQRLERYVLYKTCQQHLLHLSKGKSSVSSSKAKKVCHTCILKPVNSICYTCLKVNPKCLLQRLERYVLYKTCQQHLLHLSKGESSVSSSKARKVSHI
jgi:hypothetical protein